MRALAAPVASDGKDTVTAAGNSWGYGARTARLNVNAKSEDGTAGFSMGIYNDVSMKLEAGDEANLWIKPLDIVKVSYGKYDNNTLRGDLCYGSWNWLRPTSSWLAEDEGLLMSGNGGKGLMAEVTPVENLYVQALVPILAPTQDKNDVWHSGQVKADATYKQIRGGLAYTVPGTAKVKFQYIGKGEAKVDEVKDAEGNVTTKGKDGNSNCTIEAEVDVLAVENLFLGVGFQYNNLKDGDDNNAGDQKMKIALGASYQVNEDIKLSASGAFFQFYGKDANKYDPRFQAGVGVDYNLGDGLSANADFRYLSAQKKDGTKVDNSDHVAFSAGIQKGFSNGYIGVAFQGQTNGGAFANNVIEAAEKDKMIWAIPVALSVWF